MKHEKYLIEANISQLQFEFVSEGPRGRIRKRVTFVPFEKNSNIYNLAFGDFSPEGEIDDLVVSNNNDTWKVLATVASTIYLFLELHPQCFVYATGSTKSRIRLYRMGISKYFFEINQDFLVFGFRDNVWEVFNKKDDYEAFLLKKKN